MKRKLLLLILAMIPAAFLPLAAIGQVEPDKAPAVANEPTYKYEVFAGWGYTSLNQVNQSRSGLQGVSLSVTRNWGKYFGITAEGGHYAWGVTSSNAIVGSPTVDMYLAGPALHAPLYGRFSMMVHGLLGAGHTGSVSIRPELFVCRRGRHGSGIRQIVALWLASLWRRYRLGISQWCRFSRETRRTGASMRALRLAWCTSSEARTRACSHS